MTRIMRLLIGLVIAASALAAGGDWAGAQERPDFPGELAAAASELRVSLKAFSIGPAGAPQAALAGIPGRRLLAPPLEQGDDAAVAAELLRSIREISSAHRLEGYDYFENHPLRPELRLSFGDPAKISAEGMIGPILRSGSSYSPEKGEKGFPLEAVELRLNRAELERLSGELDRAFPGGPLKGAERARRLSRIFMPRALAQLELASIREEAGEPGIPNGLWVDVLEEVRRTYEAGALRLLLSREEALGGFVDRLPGESEYMERTLELSRSLGVAELGGRRHEGPLPGEGEGPALLIGETQRSPVDKLIALNKERLAREMRALYAKLGAEDPDSMPQIMIPPDQRAFFTKFQVDDSKPSLVRRIMMLQAAQRFLNSEGAVSSLQSSAHKGLHRAQDFMASPLKPGERELLALNIHLIGARQAAREGDPGALLSHLREAEKVARRESDLELLNLKAEQLRKACLESAVQALRRDGKDARGGLESFAEMGPDSAPLFLEALKSKDEWTRHSAVRGLAGLGGRITPEGFSALGQAARDADSSVRRAAFEGLTALGARSMPTLIAAATGGAWHMRPDAVEALGRFARKDPEEALPVLRRALKDYNPDVRKAAVEVFSELGERGLEELSGMLGDYNQGVRRSALSGISALGEAGIPILIEAAKAEDPALRQDAVEALGRFAKKNPDQVLPVLRRALEDPMPGVRLAALEPFKWLGEKGLGDMLEALGNSDYWIRESALRGIEAMGEAGIPGLIKAAADRGPALRRRAVLALGHWAARNPDQALAVLRRALKDPDPDVRRAALEGLKKLWEQGLADPTGKLRIHQDPSAED